MKNTIKKETIPGYNGNHFTKKYHPELNHVFIEGKGSFFFSKADAEKGFSKTGNETGLYFEILEHEGATLYKQLATNAWN